MGEHPEGALGNNPLPGKFKVGETENFPMHDHLNAIPDRAQKRHSKMQWENQVWFVHAK